MLSLFKPPSITNHSAIQYLSLAFYPPLISSFVLLFSSIIYLGYHKNYYYMSICLITFPIIFISFIIWLHLIIDYMNCIINKYGKDSLLDIGGNPSYKPLSIPIQNNSNMEDYQNMEPPIPEIEHKNETTNNYLL